jgi:voltage-gated sodium channel
MLPPTPHSWNHQVPSGLWLEQVLAEERAGISMYLEQRHRSLLADFAAMAADGRGKDAFETHVQIVKESDLPGRPEVLEIDVAARPTKLSQTVPVSAMEDTVSRMTVVSGSVDNIGVASQQTNGRVTVSSVSRSQSLKNMKKTLGVKGSGLGGDDGEGRPWTYKYAIRPSFEMFISGIILFNVFVMAGQIQYRGFDIGFDIGYRAYDNDAPTTWRGATIAFDTFDYVFGSIYIFELIFKIHAFRMEWTRDAWNWFDLLIVSLWLIEKPFGDVIELPADATVLRTARLFKLLRLVKLIKQLNGFDSLYLLVTALKGCTQILGWSCMVLFLVQMLIAFVIFFTLDTFYFHDTSKPIEERQKVFEYFGTFSRSMLSMFEMTLANWPPVCRLLVENVSEWFMVFFVSHKLSIGFAVIGVINGVFMQETFKVASTDDSIMMRQKEREVKTYAEKMDRLFKAADESGDGELDQDEFHKILEDREIVTWLASMELPVRDAASLFDLLDSGGSGILTAETMTKGALKLRGAAKSVDLLSMKKTLDKMHELIERISEDKKLGA